MNIPAAFILLTILALPSWSFSLDISAFPESIGNEPVLSRAAEMQTWDPENMFAQVNGEAELLKRYGAVSLAFISYENDTGDYVSVDLLDLGKPVNAYGLYRLYSGCDGEEFNIHGATVHWDAYTPYAFLGQYFLRINIDISADEGKGNTLVADILKHFSEQAGQQPALPSTLVYLQANARNPCEVDYYPEHIDYDLQTGPGYSWVGQDEGAYAVMILDSEDDAELLAATLKNKGVASVMTWKNAVIWAKAEQIGSPAYMETVVKEIVNQ